MKLAEVNMNTVISLNITERLGLDFFDVTAAPHNPQMSVNESIMVIRT